MNDNITIKKLFCDMLKFMISVMALCCSFSYFLKVVYSYAIEGLPLLVAVKYNFMHIYLLLIAGLAVWLTIKEKGLTFTTSLILFTSGYFGRLLGEDIFIREEFAVRITAIFVVVMLVLGYLRYRYRGGETRLLDYLILAACTVFLSCINDVGLIAYWLQIFDFNYVKDFVIGMYVPCSAGLIYFFEVMIRNEVLHVNSPN
jgi:uncharacterized membrane protein